jgi:hypothetical protein
MALSVPFMRSAMSSVSVVPACPASTTIDGFAPDDDVVEAKGEDHFFGNAVLLGFAGGSPVGVWAEALVQVAAVVVDQVVAAINHLSRDQERSPLGLRAVGLAGVEAIHAFAVDRIDVRNLLKEGRDVDQRKEHNRTGKLRWVDGWDQFFQRDDRGVFGAMGAGNKCEHWTRLGAVDHDDWNARSRVNARGDIEIAVTSLSSGSRSGADAVRRALRRRRGRKAKEQCQTQIDVQQRSRHCLLSCLHRRSRWGGVASDVVAVPGEVTLEAVFHVRWRFELVVLAGVDDQLGGAAKRFE